MVLPVLLGLTALFLVGALTARRGWARLFRWALAVPAAVLTYGVLGVGIARAIAVGHFYSLPVGAEEIEDWHIVVSLLFWTIIWGALIEWLFRLRSRHVSPGD